MAATVTCRWSNAAQRSGSETVDWGGLRLVSPSYRVHPRRRWPRHHRHPTSLSGSNGRSVATGVVRATLDRAASRPSRGTACPRAPADVKPRQEMRLGRPLWRQDQGRSVGLEAPGLSSRVRRAAASSLQMMQPDKMLMADSRGAAKTALLTVPARLRAQQLLDRIAAGADAPHHAARVVWLGSRSGLGLGVG